MQTILVVLGAMLAVAAGWRGLRPAAGAGDVALRVLGGGGLLALAVAALSAGAPAGAAIAAAAALPLLAGPALPWVFSRGGALVGAARTRSHRDGAPTPSR